MPESFKNKSMVVAMGDSGLAGWSWFHSCPCYFTRRKVPESKLCDRHYECHRDTAEALACLWPPLISAATEGDISLWAGWTLEYLPWSGCFPPRSFTRTMPTHLAKFSEPRVQEVNDPGNPQTLWINSVPSPDHWGRHSACFLEGLAD